MLGVDVDDAGGVVVVTPDTDSHLMLDCFGNSNQTDTPNNRINDYLTQLRETETQNVLFAWISTNTTTNYSNSTLSRVTSVETCVRKLASLFMNIKTLL